MMKPVKDSLDIGVIVSDIKASLNFYRNILGLEFVESVPLWF
jgi:catechol 2,3-dioxygenase-like lactoylglutathione lyase family enzyme